MDMSQPSAQQLSEAAAPAPAERRMDLGELMAAAGQLQAQGQAAAAAALYEQWIAGVETPNPLMIVALYNLGTVYSAMSDHARAEAVYRRALAYKPDFLQARLNLGHQLEQLGRKEDALQAWRVIGENEQAGDSVGADPLELRLHALRNMARLLEQERRYAESEQVMRQSLQLRADQSDVLQHYVHIRQKQCEWPVYQPVGEVTLNQLLTSTSLLAMLGLSDDPALQLLSAQRFVSEKVVKYKDKPFHRRFGRARREGKLRIGYLSGDLCMHAVGMLTAELFELHDRERVEVHAFCWSREDGTPLRARILRAMDSVTRLVGVDDETAARAIAQAGIDVLIDLQGLTSGARPNILAYRPAPVQVSYLGLPATTAIPGVDWIIADRFVMPEDYLPYCTERPIYLEHCYQVSDRQREVGAVPNRAQYGLPEQGTIFCTFNNTFKITEPVFASWMSILQAVPGSVLWLLADNDWARENMQRQAEALGVARERLIFAPRVAPADYLARFALADLMLDTFPYNAGTTASDALWMGLPIVTLAGRSVISRMAGSLLTAVGLPELITDTLADYEALAIRLGRQPARIASLKRYLAEEGRRSPLFDLPARVRDIEAAFERLALQARG